MILAVLPVCLSVSACVSVYKITAQTATPSITLTSLFCVIFESITIQFSHAVVNVTSIEQQQQYLTKHLTKL